MGGYGFNPFRRTRLTLRNADQARAHSQGQHVQVCAICLSLVTFLSTLGPAGTAASNPLTDPFRSRAEETSRRATSTSLADVNKRDKKVLSGKRLSDSSVFIVFIVWPRKHAAG